MNVLACPDKFRGTASAPEVARAIARAVEAEGGTCRQLPLADGGEGTLQALGGGNRETVVTGPLGQPTRASWQLRDDGTAVIEAAQACGLALAGGAAHNDPEAATTRGVGEMIVAALREGATRILVGVGGSATTDGGAGARSALHEAGADLHSSVDVVVCCDVTTPFTRAADVFGPQKGATPAQVFRLTAQLEDVRRRTLRQTGIDLDALPGSGAAGGLSGGLASAGARLVPGFHAVAEAVGLREALADADLVITGEGRLDATSLNGKVVGGVVDLARRSGVPARVVCGIADIDPGVPVLDLNRRFGSRSFTDTSACIVEALRGIVASMSC